MITEAIFGVFLDLVMGIIGGIINLASAPVSGTFSIPRPLFVIVEISVFAFTAVYPVVGIWFLWRQIKA